MLNVATGGRVSLNQLFRIIRGLVGARVEAGVEATLEATVGGAVEPIYAAARQGDVRDSQADIRKAGRLLGYEPTVSLDSGLRSTIEWHRASQTVVA